MGYLLVMITTILQTYTPTEFKVHYQTTHALRQFIYIATVQYMSILCKWYKILIDVHALSVYN